MSRQCPNCNFWYMTVFDFDPVTNEPYYFCSKCNCRTDSHGNIIERTPDEAAMSILLGG